MKLTIFIWSKSTWNYIIQGFSRIRGKEAPAQQADINPVQLLINQVWALALQFRILVAQEHFCFDYLITLALSTEIFLQTFSQNDF